MNIPKYRAVPSEHLIHLMGLIDPAPVQTADGMMVFKNPHAAEILTAISETVRKMVSEPSPQPVPGVTWEAQGEANQYMLFKDGRWLASVQMNGEYWVEHQELFLNSLAEPHKCNLPPAGWACSRRAGHSGPCAANPVDA